MMIKHESIAKAELKGAIRKVQSRCDNILELRANNIESKKCKKSRKKLLKRFEEELGLYGEFLVTKTVWKRKTTWHFDAEFSAIEPEIINVDGIGGLCRFLIRTFNSRKFMKGNLCALDYFCSNFYFHEHFLIRAIQRFGLNFAGELGIIIYPVIEWLVLENVSLKHFKDTNYFVFEDFVIVTNKLPHSNGLFFKTILIRQYMNKKQFKIFKSSFELLENSYFKVVMTDGIGGISTKIAPPKMISLTKSLTERSYWVQHITQQQDIRFKGNTLSEIVDDLILTV
ncbi:MAG: hypothetical protein ACI9LM_005203 [Alteromonadaceae bacterium]|jgi:hypothetical protein